MFKRVNDIDFNSTVVGNNNVVDNDMNVDINMYNNQMGTEINGGMSSPITEQLQEKCVHRTIVHEVPQDCFFMIEK